MKKIFIALFAITILFFGIGNANTLVDSDFQKIMVKNGYPDRTYKTQPIIEREMSAYNTNLKAFQVQIGENPDGFLTKIVFEKWQEWKRFQKDSWYRDNNPHVATDQGNARFIYKPLNIRKGQKQFIFELESYDNEIVIAFNLKKHLQFARHGVVICGYGKSKRLFRKYLTPLKDMKGYYIIKVSLPYNKVFHFRIVKFGTNYKTFDQLPFKISYKELAERKLIRKEIGKKFGTEKCQALIKSNQGISFLYFK